MSGVEPVARRMVHALRATWWQLELQVSANEDVRNRHVKGDPCRAVSCHFGEALSAPATCPKSDVFCATRLSRDHQYHPKGQLEQQRNVDASLIPSILRGRASSHYNACEVTSRTIRAAFTPPLHNYGLQPAAWRACGPPGLHSAHPILKHTSASRQQPETTGCPRHWLGRGPIHQCLLCFEARQGAASQYRSRCGIGHAN